MSTTYAIGIDFGTWGRALLVDVADGPQIATAVHPYANGVIDRTLPESGKSLPTGRYRIPMIILRCSKPDSRGVTTEWR